MSKRIEEVFNDCFERLLLGESLESCLHRYPEYAAELDSMLRTAFDIKRKAFPVQPRPEFKYWARIRMQNVQYYSAPEPIEEKVSASNLRRNLAFSLAALLVFLIASSGTAAASSQAMPDEPLYGVKMAVEQTQLTLTTSEIDKATLYAQLAEKRAQEIAVMADKGKTDQVIATTAKLNYQLDQADALLAKYQAALAASGVYPGSSTTATRTVTVPPITYVPVAPSIPQVTTPTPAPAAIPPLSAITSAAVSENTTVENAILVTAPVQPTTALATENSTAENTTLVTAPVQPTTAVTTENSTAENTTLVTAPIQPTAAVTTENSTAENTTLVTVPVQPTTAVAAENSTAENTTLVTAPLQPTTAVAAENSTAENATTAASTATSDNGTQAGSKRSAAFAQHLNDVNRAKSDIDASTDKSLTILQNALDKAPESVKSSLTDAIQKTRAARARITSLQTSSDNQTSTTSVTNTTTNNSNQQQNTTNSNNDKHRR